MTGSNARMPGIVSMFYMAALLGYMNVHAHAQPARNSPWTQPPVQLPKGLAQANALLDAAQRLRLEIDVLTKQPADFMRDARIAYRRVAFDLLFHGAAAPIDAQEMAMSGLRLAALCPAIDALLAQTQTAQQSEVSVQEALQRFIRTAEHGLEPLPASDRPEVTLVPTLRALEEAVAIKETGRSESPSTAWPLTANLPHIGPPVAPRTEPQAAIAAASWLDERTRTALTRAWTVTETSQNTASKEEIAASVRALQIATQLIGRPRPWTTTAAQSIMLSLAEQPNMPHIQRISALFTAADLCAAFDLASVRSDLRMVASDVLVRSSQSAVLAADGLMRRLPASDPAAQTSEQALLDAATDLTYINSLPNWVDAISAMRAPSRAAFDSASRQWVASLRDAKKRDATRIIMSQFAYELAFLNQSDSEQAIRRGEGVAVKACAGRSTELLKQLDSRRDAWALAWSNGKGSTAAAQAALRAVRVLEALQISAEVAAGPATPDALSAWAGLFPPEGSWTVHPKALVARSALALEALLAADDLATDRELHSLEIDLPVAVLALELSHRLTPWLKSRNSTAARLVAVRDAPGPDAFLGDHRGSLMQLSRCLLEESRCTKNRQDAERLQLREMAATLALTMITEPNTSMPRIAELRAAAEQLAARTNPPQISQPKRR